MAILIIVESPAKAKKIQSFLGSNYIVRSSIGHIREISKTGPNKLGIDIDDNFKPDYIISPDKKTVVNDLKINSKSCTDVILASDEDREGEAISWHISQILNLKNPKRMVFHEITKKAIDNALKNLRDLDINLVNAQQARVVLDKLVGYEISPLLWKNIQYGLSAGRVQSVAMKIIIDKENNINQFNSNSYWKTNAIFNINNNNLNSKLNTNFDDKIITKSFLEKIKLSKFTIGNIEKKNIKKFPLPPFTTSTLQQEAGKHFGHSTKIIMANAQTLYENGFITYHRTDCISISDDCISNIKTFILQNYGEQYLGLHKYINKNKNTQEAHEAIRPTNIMKKNIDDTDFSPSHKKLYEIIWKRTIASQMAPCELESWKVIINISNVPEFFISNAEKIIFNGFKIIYDYKDINDNDDDDIDDNIMTNIQIILSLKSGTILNYKTITSTENFTKPPPRFNEPSIIKKMEELGIGRPSTYASIINTIQDRQYVVKETRKGIKKKYQILLLQSNSNIISESINEKITETEKNKLFPTEIGKNVNNFLNKHFQYILDYNFTSNVENELDEIANGKKIWQNVVKNVYDSFHPNVIKLIESNVNNNNTNQIHDTKRIVGKVESTGDIIYSYLAKYGPVIQIGNSNPIKYVKIPSNYSYETITEEQANSLLLYPKNIGIYLDKNIYIKDGKFGIYINWNEKNYSINSLKEDDIDEIKAIEIIKTKEDTLIKQIGQNIKIMNGSYGPFILMDNKIIKITGNKLPQNLTEFDCKNMQKNSKKYIKKI